MKKGKKETCKLISEKECKTFHILLNYLTKHGGIFCFYCIY